MLFGIDVAVVVAGVAGFTAVVEGVVLYRQSNELSQLKKGNKDLLEQFDSKLKKVVEDNQSKINELKVKIDEGITEKQKLVEEKRDLIANIDKSEKKRDKDKKIDVIIKQNQELIKELVAILNLSGVKTAIQKSQEAGGSNYSVQTITENLQEVSKSNSSNITETPDLHETNDRPQTSDVVVESSDELDDDIVVIPSPNSEINEPILFNHISKTAVKR